MKGMRILYILFFFFIQLSASAQKVYFIYLQSDNGSPFYVKMKDKIFSSSHPGYLIIPNLVDSTYQFSLGFSSSQPEARFIVPLGARDRGFLIKEFDQGPGLFDLQTLSVIKAQATDTKKTSYQVRKDEFTALLAKAADDSSLLYVPVYAKQDLAVQETKQPEKPAVRVETPVMTQPQSRSEEVPDTVTKITASKTDSGKPDSVTVAAKEINTPSVSQHSGTSTAKSAPESLTNKTAETGSQSTIIEKEGGATIEAPAEVYRRSVVKKYSETSTTEGYGIVFHDTRGENTDTIQILIPNPLIAFRQVDSTKVETAVQPNEAHTETPDPPRIVVAVKTSPSAEKSKCRFKASNSDFFRLRKNMAAKESDQAMINEANRFFKTKCFTTEQVRNLSTLFLTSSGKYQFFDAAYLHVSDQENFASLDSEIREEYFLKRFKALVGQ